MKFKRALIIIILFFFIFLFFYYSNLTFLDTLPSSNGNKLINKKLDYSGGICDIVDTNFEIIIDHNNEEILLDEDELEEFDKAYLFSKFDYFKIYLYNLHEYYNKKFEGSFKSSIYYQTYFEFKNEIESKNDYKPEKIIEAYIIEVSKPEFAAYEIVITKEHIYVVLLMN